MSHDFFQNVHPEWRPFLQIAIEKMDQDYVETLKTTNHWLPGIEKMFNAFSIPVSKTRFILLGESPYPRIQSANGYAFWDDAVQELWSDTGLSKTVNRATSLRNFIKMLLFARGDLTHSFSKDSIAALKKDIYVQTGRELFEALLSHGFLLLNATLVYRKGEVKQHALHWRPFLKYLLLELQKQYPELRLILFGKIAGEVKEASLFQSLIAEHPYNISFITNPSVVEFFKPFDLLIHEKK